MDMTINPPISRPQTDRHPNVQQAVHDISSIAIKHVLSTVRLRLRMRLRMRIRLMVTAVVAGTVVAAAALSNRIH